MVPEGESEQEDRRRSARTTIGSLSPCALMSAASVVHVKEMILTRSTPSRGPGRTPAA
jgi:hypothetical protein